jgi:hypothetical protein
MTEAESTFAFALKQYGDKTIMYAQASDSMKRSAFDAICYWQEKMMEAAKAIAEERKA